MEETKKFIPELTNLFSEFLSSRDKVEFIYGLTKLEKKIRKELKIKNKEQGLWWRFFAHDTLVNDIRSMEKDLSNTYGTNYKYTVECIEIAVENPKDIKILFS